jgi:hypothetical protein
MSEHETRAPRSLYDRETEPPNDDARDGGRRRPVADWGGDELFTRFPRRRAAHPGGQRARRLAASEPDPLNRLAAELEGTHEPAAEADAVDEAPPARRFVPSETAEQIVPAEPEGLPAPRPTVVIGRDGRPEAPHPEAPFLSVSRRRPPRTVVERIGASPERIVAWAFALGLLLILIAVATADAAVGPA